MIRPILCACVLALPAHAMTGEDCKRIQATLSKTVPAVNDLRLAPTTTEDGWCQVVDGPLGAGLEWRVTTSGASFTAEFRQKGLEIDTLGPFTMAGAFQRTEENRLEIGPIKLETRQNDMVLFSAASPTAKEVSTGTSQGGLDHATLAVSGESGLIDEILAWAFRLDIAAARSSFIAARDQRRDMLDWLENEAAKMTDVDSKAAFRKMIEAYPRSKGTAQISIREDRPVPVGGVVSAVLFGTSLTRGDAAGLIEDAGLRFTWQPR